MNGDTEGEGIGFEIEDEVVVGDISKVATSEILPICQNVLGQIRKATRQASKDGSTTGIKLEMVIVDGIPTENAAGEIEYRYRNKVFFPASKDLLYKRDKMVKTSEYYKDGGSWLRGLKEFMSALGLSTSDVRINDEFFISLVGRKLLFSVKHEPNQVLNEEGKWVDDGTHKDRIYGWKKAVDSE